MTISTGRGKSEYEDPESPDYLHCAGPAQPVMVHGAETNQNLGFDENNTETQAPLDWRR